MSRSLQFLLLNAFLAFALASICHATDETNLHASANQPTDGPASVAHPTAESEKLAAEAGVGRWIWTTNFADKQEVRFWRTFSVPATNAVRRANLLITADNLYRLYLDGREIGQGANWKNLTDYDITWLLDGGTHVLAVETLNDNLQGGLILGLHIEFADGRKSHLLSDRFWRIVPLDTRRWINRTTPDLAWPLASEVGVVGQSPWWSKPMAIASPPPLRPIDLHFWQRGWFFSGVMTICIIALILSVRLAAKLAVHMRAQRLVERERARMARDIHDDLGSALTQLVLQGEVAQTEFPEGSPARLQLDQLCERARVVSHALEEVLWVVNSKRDTVRDFCSYVCKFAQSFLSSTSIRCRLDVQPDMPSQEFDLPVRRGLFLAVKEALNNAAKHSEATELFLRIFRDAENLIVIVEDNGRGFDASLLTGEGNGVTNMQQRLAEMGGACTIISDSGAGCRVEFKLPLANTTVRHQSWWQQLFGKKSANGKDVSLESRLPVSESKGLSGS